YRAPRANGRRRTCLSGTANAGKSSRMRRLVQLDIMRQCGEGWALNLGKKADGSGDSFAHRPQFRDVPRAAKPNLDPDKFAAPILARRRCAQPSTNRSCLGRPQLIGTRTYAAIGPAGGELLVRVLPDPCSGDPSTKALQT